MKRNPPPRGAARPFVPPTFSERRLKNGLRTRAARWGTSPAVAVAMVLPGAGSAADPEGLEGLAEIAGECFLGGTAGRTAEELARAIDDLALVVDVSAGFDSTVARLYVLSEALDEGLGLFAEVLSRPSFPETEVDKVRRRHADLLAEQRSEPDFLARERLLDRLYPGHPYGRLAASERGLQAIRRADVATFAERRAALGGGTLLLAGDLSPERLLEAADRSFGNLPLPEPAANPALPAAPRVGSLSLHLVHRPHSVQTNLLFARPALRRREARYAEAIVANQSLGGGASSRLFHVLREERGLTYGAYSALNARVGAGHFGASIDCRTEVTDAALGGLLDLVRAYASEGPSREENARSKAYLSGTFVLAREGAASIVQDETTRLLHGLPEDEFLTWRPRLEAVDEDAARAAARDYFDPAVGVVAAVGDAEKIRPILETFGDTTLWDADGPRA